MTSLFFSIFSFFHQFLKAPNLNPTAPSAVETHIFQNLLFRRHIRKSSKKPSEITPQTLPKSQKIDSNFIKIDIKNAFAKNMVFYINFDRFFSIFGTNFGAKSGSQIQKIDFFRYLGPTWANLGQKGAPRPPKRVKMRSRSIPRQAK